MKLNKLIHIDFLPNRDLMYSGVSVLNCTQTLILINFDFKTKQYDGYTVFRSREITRYSYWDKSELQKVKKDNWRKYLSLIDIEKMKTFYSCLKFLPSGSLISIFTGNNNDNYYVGKITSLSRNSVTFRLIDQDGKWTRLKRMKISDINYFSFGTKYELKLAKNDT